jgi:ornithine cyclodeaminase
VVVQYEPQSRIEGDIQQMPADYQAIELWRILAGETEGRQSADQITIFDSVGFSIEDFSALRTVLRLAETHQIGQTIPLIPDLADVKDLYGLLTP